MLRAITLDGLRSFPDAERIELGPLTVLAGANSVGKSTVIHALMALVQSDQQASQNALVLAGEWVDLGDFRQALNYSRSGDERRFRIGVTSVDASGGCDAVWTFAEDPGDSGGKALIESVEVDLDGEAWRASFPDAGAAYRWSRVVAGSRDERDAPSACQFRSPLELSATNFELPLRLLPYAVHDVHYLGAYRDRPRRLFDPRRPSLSPTLGAMGECTAEALVRGRTSRTNVTPGAEEAPLLTAVNQWWSRIFAADLNLSAQSQGRLGYSITVDTPGAENVELGQVGLGLSQLLPVVTLCCLAPPRSLVVIESPEIHLHPAAQHRLGELLVALVRSGRQVVVETHSDHLVNALRLAVKRGRESGGLDVDDLAIQFFSETKGATSARRVAVDEDGRLPEWPEGFFDQSTKALLELLT